MATYEFYMPKAKDDPERAIFPTLMWVSGKNKYIKCQILILGWWRWGVALKRVAPNKELLRSDRYE